MSVAKESSESKLIDFTDSDNEHDRILIVGEKKFYVMSGILSNLSEYFASMFEGQHEEVEHNEIELNAFDPKAFEEFLNILYDNSVATLEAELLVPLIDLSLFFVAPKIFDSCKSYVEQSLDSTDRSTIVDVLNKACEKNFDDLKAIIVNYLKSDTVMDTFEYDKMVDFANKHELVDLKNWLGSYLFKKFSLITCSYWLDYSAENDLPTLKSAIIDEISRWGEQKPKYGYYTGLSSKLIPEYFIIGLMESAFKHNVDILKAELRKRIYYMLKTTGNNYCENKYGACHFLPINAFLEKNHEKIFALPKKIREYIIISVICDI